MQKNVLLLCLVLVSLVSKSQPVICAHSQSFYFEVGNAIANTNDGGCIIAGLTAEYGTSTQGEAYLLKLDSNYNVQWGKTVSNSLKSTFYDVAQTFDGGYISVGSYESQSNIPHFLIVKTDAVGDLQWQQTLGSAGNDNGYVVKQMPDSGYVVVGHTYVNSLWAIRLSQQGAILWVSKITGAGGKLGLGAVVAADSGIVVCGYNGGFNSIADGNALVAKLDKEGKLLWCKGFGGVHSDLFHTIEKSHTGGYILGGHTGDTTVASGNMMLLAKIDDNGSLIWAKSFGGQYDDRVQSIIKTHDGNYCASAFTITDTIGIDTYNSVLFKFDELGNPIWMKKRNYFTGDICNNIKENGSYQLIQTGNYFADVSLTVADSMGNSCCYSNMTLTPFTLSLPEMAVGVIDTTYTNYSETFIQASGGIMFTDCITQGFLEYETETTSINLFPNPFSNQFQISFSNNSLNRAEGLQANDEIILRDLMGKSVFTRIITKPTSTIRLQPPKLVSGIYLLTIKTKQSLINRKVICQN